jgi:hypothetical protein
MPWSKEHKSACPIDCVRRTSLNTSGSAKSRTPPSRSFLSADDYSAINLKRSIAFSIAQVRLSGVNQLLPMNCCAPAFRTLLPP